MNVVRHLILAMSLAFSTLIFAAPPPNDNFVDAEPLTGESGSVMGTTLEATAETGEPAQNGTINSIWYSWQAPSEGLFIFDTCGSGFDTFLSAFSGTAVNALTTLGQNDDACGLQSRISVSANAAGDIFHIAVDGFSGNTGSVILNYDIIPNDNFADAVLITGESGTVMGSNIGTTGETGEPVQSGALNSIWYRWTAPSEGIFVFDTCGSDFDTFLSIFSGDAVDALTTLGQNDDACGTQSRMSVSANAAGELFHIAVDGFDVGTGLVTLNYTPASELLVKDIIPGANSSGPSFLTNVNGTLFFDAFDPTNGRELWMSDGTQMGTVLVKDIFPGGANSSFPQVLTNVNGNLFFAAFDPTNGFELWMSDGTQMGTVLVKDISPGSPSSFPSFLTNVNGTLFFTANDGTNGFELWSSDGTSDGTTIVKDIRPGAIDTFPTDLTNVNGTLFFRATDVTNGQELWMSDGTQMGTVLVKDINPGTGSSAPSNLTNVNGALFFTANDGTNGNELWMSDGTSDGTTMVKHIRPGGASSNPANLTQVNGTLFFDAFDAEANGRELWQSDGTEIGTIMTKDIRSGSPDSNPSNLTNVNGALFFRVDDGTNGIELWTSDGTEIGTMLVKDINPGANNASPSNLTNVNGALFFKASDGTNGPELWMSDGTSDGTVLVEDIIPGFLGSDPRNLTNVNGTLFFTADDGLLGTELYKGPDVISNFTDVPPGSFGFQFIEDFFGAQITGGCALGNYCPNDPVTREQMAVFLEKAANGPDFTPPPSIGLFDDVSIDSPFAPWIEQLFRDGITGGCGFNIYCPDQTVTRGQMAVFIEKALRGSDFAPPAATGVFNDVPASNGFAPWIEQLANDNITGGCGGGNYCPNNPVTRAQMAIFMGKAFELGYVPTPTTL